MLTIYQKTPERRHWDNLKRIKGMTPDEFRQRWNVTYAEMASICRCSENTVKRWFASSGDHRPPQATHLALLDFTNREWSRRRDDESYDISQMEIYERIKERNGSFGEPS